MSCSDGGVGCSSDPDIGIMKVHNTFPLEFTSSVNRLFSRNWLTGCGMAKVTVHAEIPDKGKTYTFSSCNSSDTGCEIFWHKRPKYPGKYRC